MAVDGQYINTHVRSYVANHFNVEAHDDLDPLHAARGCDARLRNESRFKHLNEVNDII